MIHRVAKDYGKWPREVMDDLTIEEFKEICASYVYEAEMQKKANNKGKSSRGNSKTETWDMN